MHGRSRALVRGISVTHHREALQNVTADNQPSGWKCYWPRRGARSAEPSNPRPYPVYTTPRRNDVTLFTSSRAPARKVRHGKKRAKPARPDPGKRTPRPTTEENAMRRRGGGMETNEYKKSRQYKLEPVTAKEKDIHIMVKDTHEMNMISIHIN